VGTEPKVVGGANLCHVTPEAARKLQEVYPETWRALDPPILLPHGWEFTTWEPVKPMTFKKTWYVDGGSGQGFDRNSGGEKSPFLTIGKPVAVAQPGEQIVVTKRFHHESVVVPRGKLFQDGQRLNQVDDVRNVGPRPGRVKDALLNSSGMLDGAPHMAALRR
jgi:hypothetical protein